MSAEGGLLAVQLANQRLVEAQQKAQNELDRMHAENLELKQQNARLQARLTRTERLNDTLKADYKLILGKEFTGKMQITKFGFQQSA